MANPQVDNLIAELSAILEQNRQKRNAAEAMMQGIQQGKARAAQGRGDDQAKPAQSGPQLGPEQDYMDGNDGLGPMSPRYRQQGKINQHFQNMAQGDKEFDAAYEQAMFDRDFAKSQRQPLVPTPDLGPPAQYPQYQAGQVQSPDATTMQGRTTQANPLNQPAAVTPQKGFSPQEMQLLDALAQRYEPPR